MFIYQVEFKDGSMARYEAMNLSLLNREGGKKSFGSDPASFVSFGLRAPVLMLYHEDIKSILASEKSESRR